MKPLQDAPSPQAMQTNEILEALQRDGIAVLANVISPDQLAEVQLVECKGWCSRATRKDWHGWHGDGWYEQDAVVDMPRELKLAFYLSVVRSGGFEYLKGSHRKTKPRSVPLHEIGTVWKQERLLINGIAGTAFLFDTSGIHRQSTPILEPRIAAFYCYHDPALPLQQEDIEYGRYHPLLLNAAFLGGLSSEQQRMLGFGGKSERTVNNATEKIRRLTWVAGIKPRKLGGFERACIEAAREAGRRGAGLVVLEAMVANCAVIASNIGGIPEIIRDGIDGVLVPPADADALAATIIRLWRAPAQRAALVASARNRASSIFALDRMIHRYWDIYRDSAASAAAQPRWAE